MKKNYFLAVYVLIILALTIIIGLNPDYNWDMLAYMSIVKKMDGVKPFNKVHEAVYSEAQKNIPQKKYTDLIDAKDIYRKKMAQNAFAFETQLPFYYIKPIYILTAFIFYKTGVSLTYATVLPSLISFFLINLISFFWISKLYLSFKAKLLILLLICAITIPLAARSNPDGLSSLFLLLSAYFFLEYKKLFPIVLFLALSILVRPENIIFSLLLYSVIITGKWKMKIPLYVSIVYLCLMAACYYLPQKIWLNPGWSSLFYHAFINDIADPSLKQTITIPVYISILKNSILNVRGILIIAFLSGLSLLILQPKKIQYKNIELYKLFYTVVIVSFIIKFLVFPMPGFRFILPTILLLMLAGVKAYELKFSEMKSVIKKNL